MINERMEKIGNEQSIIRRLFCKGIELKQKYGSENVFDFSIGNPNIKPNMIVNESLINILKNENPILLHGYSVAQGDIVVREKVAQYKHDVYGANANKDYIYLTSGAASGISIICIAILNANDEVIVFAPYFPEYKIFVNNANANIVLVKPNFHTFYPDFVALGNKITNKTKLVIINSPNNPTGVFYRNNVINNIVNIVKRKQNEYNNDIYILSDEPYRELLYIDEKYKSIDNYFDNTITTYSFSKSLSLPGERIGYILINNECRKKQNIFNAICGAARSMGYVCETTLFQRLIPQIQGSFSDFSVYKKNREFLYENLVRIGYDVVYPDGAFYMFIKSPVANASDFSNSALDNNLIIVPSDTFGINGYTRIAYCTSFDMIEKSINIFEKIFKESKVE